MSKRLALIGILEALSVGDISIDEAAIRAELLLDDPPHGLTCGSCRFYKKGCYRPGFPARPEHPQSIRCIGYERDDPRDHALPPDRPRGRNAMFK